MEPNMLQQIIVKTPTYVWAILAFLVFRGVVVARDRDITLTRMLIIPIVMLALSLQGMATKFGADALAWSAWVAATGAVMLQRWTFGAGRVSAGTAPGSVRLRGSWAPLVLMLAIFLVNYVVAVLLVIRPDVRGNAAFAATVCSLFGACNGYFLGQLARDMASYRRASGAHALPA
jgi:hypothetical protein